MTTEWMEPGRIIGTRFEIVELIGSGGFGATYLARNLDRFGGTCVVKELLPARQGNAVAQRLFEREARVLCDLSHPQIPQMLAYFEADGRFFLVQDFVDGETLAARLKRDTRIPEPELRDILLQLLDVLHYLHSRTPPVIHRDIKPANIILARDGRVVLIDFGAVREAIGGDEKHTSIGTAGYTPREQAVGRTTPASDCYAVGATALHAISGRHPVDWHDRTTGALDWKGQIACTPQFEQFLGVMLADLATRIPNAGAARDALLHGQTVIDAPPAPDASLASTVIDPPPAATPKPPRATATPASTAPRRRSSALPIAGGLLAIGAAVIWVTTRDEAPSTTKASVAPTATAAPVATADSSCAEPRTIRHRTESQFDLNILCPAAWTGTYIATARATRLTARTDSTQVWAGLWRPVATDESFDAFMERWSAAVRPLLGEVSWTQQSPPGAGTAKFRVTRASKPSAPAGSLQVERVTLGASTYIVWSVLLGDTEAVRPMALQVLGSIEYLDPAAPTTPSAPR